MNPDLFSNKNSFKNVKKTDAVNKAGGQAYSRSAVSALAQYACTGTFNDTYYTDGKEQLNKVLELSKEVSDEFLAKLAIYARWHGYMKDMPAFLLAVLSTRNLNLFKQVFPKVVDNGRMLRNFAQVIRSGVVGRSSFGTALKTTIKNWLSERTEEQLFNDSVGNNPSLVDIIKMVHPKPATKKREAFYAYLLGKELTPAHKKNLPDCVKKYEAFKAGKSKEVPNVSFQMLTSLELTPENWKEIARNAKWHMTRMNLNTFQRHDVLSDLEMVDMISNRLSNQSEVLKSKAFPYQLMAAYLNATNVPQKISNALQRALEVSCENVPEYKGKVYVMIDISGSMRSPITGARGKIPASVVQCHQVASLIAACVLRKNPEAEVITFHTSANKMRLNPMDSIMTNADKLMSQPGGGTDCSAPVRLLNQEKAKADLLIIVSDMESWFRGDSMYYNHNSSTGLSKEWAAFKARNKNCKLVCLDLQATDATVQIPDRKDTLNVGGMSDNVFSVINQFIENDGLNDFWARKIEEMVEL